MQKIGKNSREIKVSSHLVVKKQNGSRALIHWCPADKRQEMSGKCSCLHRQCPVYCPLVGKGLPTVGWGCSPHVLLRLWLLFGVSLNCQKI